MRCVRPHPEAYTEDGRRRSDVAIILPGGQVAIEVQLGELSDAPWLARHHDYDQAAVTDVWVWHRSTWVPRVMFTHRQPGWILDLEHDGIGLLHAQPIPGPGSRTEGPQGCDDMRWPPCPGDQLGVLWMPLASARLTTDGIRPAINAAAEIARRAAVPCQNSYMGSELVFSVPVRLLSGTR